MGIIAFSPLAQGLLTDRYLNGIPADSRIGRDGRFLKADSLTEARLFQIRALNATRSQCPYEPLALVYRDSDSLNIAVIQPDDAMRAHLLGAIRKSTGK